MSDSLAISITIGTVQGWPAIRRAIASAEAAPTTTWRTMPSASVFQLRGLGYRLSRGPIVAITEDHCQVPPDWAKKMLDSPRRVQ